VDVLAVDDAVLEDHVLGPAGDVHDVPLEVGGRRRVPAQLAGRREHLVLLHPARAAVEAVGVVGPAGEAAAVVAAAVAAAHVGAGRGGQGHDGEGESGDHRGGRGQPGSHGALLRSKWATFQAPPTLSTVTRKLVRTPLAGSTGLLAASYSIEFSTVQS